MPISSAHVEAFASAGDPRFVYAAWRDDPARALYFLEEGHGADVRPLAKTELRCFVLECATPEITTAAPARRRHHFRHLRRPVDTHHEPESVQHRQGKALVADWLRASGLGSVSVEATTDTQRSNVADVLFALPDGSRVAFEIQYSALTVAKFIERRDRYRGADVTDVWIWGHSGKNFLRSKSTDEIVLNELQRSVAAAGGLIAWINPERGEIAIAVSKRSTERGYVLAPASHDDIRVALTIHALSNFIPSARGLDGPIIDQLRDAWRATQWEQVRRETLAEEARRAEEQKIAENRERTEHRRRSMEGQRRVDGAVNETFRRLNQEGGDVETIARIVWADRMLGEPTPANLRAVRARQYQVAQERRRQERAATAERIIEVLGARADLVDADLGILGRTLDAEFRKAGLTPSRRRQQRRLERLLSDTGAAARRRQAMTREEGAREDLPARDFDRDAGFE